jgi:hypothetical protein
MANTTGINLDQNLTLLRLVNRNLLNHPRRASLLEDDGAASLWNVGCHYGCSGLSIISSCKKVYEVGDAECCGCLVQSRLTPFSLYDYTAARFLVAVIRNIMAIGLPSFVYD